MLDCIRELRYVSQKMISVPQVPKISGKELYSLFHAPIPVYRQFILRYQPLIRYFLIFRHIGHGVHAAGAFPFFLLFCMFAHLFYRYKSCDLSLCLQLRFYLYLTAQQISPKATISINACPRRGWFYSLFPVFPVWTQGSPIFTVSDQLSDTFYICCSQMVTRQNL